MTTTAIKKSLVIKISIFLILFFLYLAMIFSSNNQPSIAANFDNLVATTLYTFKKPQSIEWYKKAALAGSNESAFNLGTIYTYDNLLKIKPDYPEAIKWYQMATARPKAKYESQANIKFKAYSLNNLGGMHGKGLGTKQDLAKAFAYYSEAAKLGDNTAVYNIGLYYETGKFVKQNYTQAAQLYKKAHTKCAFNDLGALFASGKGVEQSDKKAAACFYLAARYHTSNESLIKAYVNYRLATTSTSHKAQEFAKILSTKLKPQELEFAKTLSATYENECRK